LGAWGIKFCIFNPFKPCHVLGLPLVMVIEPVSYRTLHDLFGVGEIILANVSQLKKSLRIDALISSVKIK